MRIHLSLVDRTGAVLAEETFDSRLVTIAGPGLAHLADFTHSRMTGYCEIETDGYHAVIRDSKRTQRLRRRNAIELDGALSLRIDLYPHPDAVPIVRGACPSCGGALRAGQVGGAYRSVAREEQRCVECRTAVLSLDEAPATLGRFSDRSAGDWVHVGVASRCPRCTQSMLRSVFRSAHGDAEVERCDRCRLVVIEPDDEARLKGRA